MSRFKPRPLVYCICCGSLRRLTHGAWQTFCVKDKMVNILGFMGRIVSVAVTQWAIVVGKQP